MGGQPKWGSPQALVTRPTNPIDPFEQTPQARALRRTSIRNNESASDKGWGFECPSERSQITSESIGLFDPETTGEWPKQVRDIRRRSQHLSEALWGHSAHGLGTRGEDRAWPVTHKEAGGVLLR